MNNVVLVVGAGASASYGFPTGAELRRNIIALTDRSFAAVGFSGYPYGFAQFQRAFALSERWSIDSFLGQNAQFIELGTAAIAAVLLAHERQCDFTSDAGGGHWYRYLFNKLTEHVAFENVSFSCLKVITFNYDRSLEHYLWNSIVHAYGVTPEAALAKVRTLQALHVYGSLSSPLPTEAGQQPYLPFTGSFHGGELSVASSGIRIMSEGRDESPELRLARTWLAEAESIGILGFGFDPLNLRRLAANETMTSRSVQQIKENVYRGPRMIAATCLGMTKAEVAQAAGRCGIGPGPNRQDGLPAHFHHMKSLDLLRETLLLG